MFLISSLNGPFDSETSEGKGANTAYQVISYIQKGKQKAEENFKKFIKGEISAEDACKNDELNVLSKAYIPYSSIDEETELLDLKRGMAFATQYIKSLDSDNDGAITVAEAGPVGQLIDLINPTGKITPGKFLCWLIFQDCTDTLNGVLSPSEVAKALMVVQNDPMFTIEKLRQIYKNYKIAELEIDFVLPVPTK